MESHQAWFDAVRDGDLETAVTLYNKSNINLDANDEFDNSALYYACHNGHTPLINWLVEQGARDDDSRRCWRNALSRETLPPELLKKKKDPTSNPKKVHKPLQHFSKEQWEEKKEKHHAGRENMAISRARDAGVFNQGCSTVSVRSLKWTDELATFFDALACNTRDNRLDMRKCRLGGATGGRELLANSLKQNSTLTDIFLHQNELGDEGVELLVNNLQPSVRKLNLCTNEITDVGATAVAQFLGTERCQLTALDMNRNQIGDVGCQAVAESLLNKNQTVLETLSIMDNTVGDTGATHILQAFQQNTTLVRVNLKGNKIKEEIMKELDEMNCKRKQVLVENKVNPLEEDTGCLQGLFGA
eukprot:TRINITY_DN66700_c7_g2_i1.p1 TRINITY_DN66700_c7_g2~~TRINITY_DN66700_c7_g2_i1.p1  ORF type:complete len:359 (-),score=45.30 TRINITY_DN66700_c7_g2_i1:162-1238(-)